MPYQLPSGRWRGMVRIKNCPVESRIFEAEAEARLWERQRRAAHAERVLRDTRAPLLAEVVRSYFASGDWIHKATGTRNRELAAAQAILFLDPMPASITATERKARLRAPDPSMETDRRRRSWADRPVDEFDGLEMQRYVNARRQEKAHRDPKQMVSPDTVRIEVRFLSSVFKHAVLNRYLKQNPAIARLNGFSLPSGNRRESRVSAGQEQAVVRNAFERVRDSGRINPCLFPWLEFVRLTGCRPGEAAKVERSWVDLEQRCVNLPRRGTKRRHPRRVLLDDRLVKVLEPALRRAERAGSPYLFYSISRRGEFTPYQYNSGWRWLREETGLSMEAHGWRRELISRLFEETQLSDSQIALLVGDVNVASLEPYKHLRAERLRPAFMDHLRAQKEAMDEAHRSAVREALETLRTFGVELTPEQEACFRGESGADLIDPCAERQRYTATARRVSR